MSAYTVVKAVDDFVSVGPFPENLTLHTSGGVGWSYIQHQDVNRLRLTASGRVQPHSTAGSLAAARINIVNPAALGDVVLREPKFFMRCIMRMGTGTVREKILFGLYFKEFASAILVGKSTVSAEMESGDAAEDRHSTVVYSCQFGGGYPRFTVQNPHASQLELLAGGTSIVQGVNADAILDEVSVYIDPYQVVARWEGIGQAIPLTVIAYPHEILQLKPYILEDAPNAFVGISPMIAMASNDLTATGGRITEFEWNYFEWNARVLRPLWQPIGAYFFAQMPLDFIGFQPDAVLDISTADIGPYIIYPPTQFVDVPVTAKTIRIDNMRNPAYIDVILSGMQLTVNPYSTFTMPVLNPHAPIEVRGGGNGANIMIYSGDLNV